MKTYLDLEEIEKLEEETICLRDRLLIRLLFRLGCRISELLALKVQDIDFKNETVTIAHLKTRLNLSCPECGVKLARSHKFCPGCGISVEKPVAKALEKERKRVIPIDRESLNLLEDFIIKDRTKDLIFQVTPTRAFQVVKECAEKAGLPKLIHPESGKEHHISPHKLRDAFAVHAVKTA
jgi:integrase/recombinase XerD